MKICICCSLSHTQKVLKLTTELETLGHEVLLPGGVIDRLYEKQDFNPVDAKVANDAIRKHVEKIKESDAVLICNYTKGDIKNYIGANTFLEMGYAHYFGKPIYVLNPLPDQPYIHDEIHSFDAVVLDGDLTKIQ
jgi:nucleoside 2-deoxyribosyltransferase